MYQNLARKHADLPGSSETPPSPSERISEGPGIQHLCARFLETYHDSKDSLFAPNRWTVSRLLLQDVFGALWLNINRCFQLFNAPIDL